MKILFSARGGGWFGIYSLSWPFVGLKLSEDRLEVQYPSLTGITTKVLKWEEISYAKRFVIIPFLADGIEVVPKNSFGSFFVFWGFSNDKIMSILLEHGVSNSGPESKSISALRFIPWVFLVFIVVAFVFMISQGV